MPRFVREQVLLDDAYRAIVANLEAIRDPVRYDPLPRHAQHFGASFAVTTSAYRRAGGLPRLPQMEDLALYAALHRIDARVRHAPTVRVSTSARTIARVDGGLATRLGSYARAEDRDDCADVETPMYTLARIDARAALRRMWRGRGRSDDRERIETTYGISREVFRRSFDASDTFGANAQRMESLGDTNFHNPERVPLNHAIRALHGLASETATSFVSAPDRVATPTI